MNLFNEIASANRAYCAALGLSAAELYGTAPNAEELEVHNLIAAGVPAEAAVPRIVEKYRTGLAGDIVAMRRRHLEVARECRLTRAKYRSHYPATPFERLAKVERACKPHAVIEYANPDARMELFAAALGKYYAECRARGGVVFVGD